MSRYLARVAEKEKALDHRKFLKSVETWVSEHNQNPDNVKLKSKTDLKKGHESLDVQESVGGGI